jgi:ABC transport system ATP-binding/permease protein
MKLYSFLSITFASNYLSMTSYLRIENLTKSYGTFVMFENISFQLAKGQKIALIAPNGTGKTSLFNIIAGKDSADSGTIDFNKEITIGFLEQDPAYDENKTVIEQVFSSSAKIVHVIEKYEKALVSNDKSQLQFATEQMELNHAWDFESQIKQILGKLKISDFDKKMGILSGGQRKRIALANALINKPDLLILDEPTNHLDIEMTEWLEEYLSNGSFTILMVTHDRYFLDRICNEILELDNTKLFQYKGNFSYYLEKRSERLDIASTDVEKARNLMRKELDWIRRMPKARGTKAKYRVNAFDELKQKASESVSEKKVKINVQLKRLGSKIIEIEKLNKSFNNIPIIKDFSYKFSKYEKVGIVGANGSGKTTFLNLITNQLKPDSGNIETGETISFGFYKQEGLQFDENMRVIDVATEVAEVVTLGNGTRLGVSQFLNYFLFPPSVQYNYVYKLSGGEKRRLYLMTVLMRNPNFLILDEPTNDLDILTLNVLEDYIQNFQGCVIIVSHDRYFMDKLADHIFVFEGNGIIKDFPGNYSDYHNYTLLKEKENKSPGKKDSLKSIRPEKAKIISSNKLSHKERKELELLTVEIEQLENEKKMLEQLINAGISDHLELMEKSKRIGEIISLIDRKSERWMELSEMNN